MTRAFPLPQAVLLAVLLHAVAFLVLSPSLRKGPSLQKIDLVFWGSILRAQDLIPGPHDTEGIADVRVISPVGYVQSAQVSAWKFGSSVEKPVRPQAIASFSEELSPEKFVTERVVLDEAPEEGPVMGLPKAENVSLKESEP